MYAIGVDSNNFILIQWEYELNDKNEYKTRIIKVMFDCPQNSCSFFNSLHDAKIILDDINKNSTNIKCTSYLLSSINIDVKNLKIYELIAKEVKENK